jgi:hypothetical protein
MQIFRAVPTGCGWRFGLLPLVFGVAVLSHAGSIIPYGVNNSGEVVGEFTGGSTPIAFMYNLAAPGSYTTYTNSGWTSSEFLGITDAGQITGNYTTTSGNFGFTLTSGTLTPFNVPGAVQSTEGNSSYILNGGGGTEVEGINNSGTIVGGWLKPSTGGVGFLYSNGAFTNTDIAYPSAVFTDVRAINDFGIAVGTAELDISNVYTQVPFLYDTNTGIFTTLSDPGVTNLHVEGISNSGEAVGFYNPSGALGQPGTAGFTYQDGFFAPFMVPGANVTEIFSISSNGDITGVYSCASDPSCESDPAFVAVPTQNGYAFTTLPNLTPEPGTFVLLGFGLVALCGIARRASFRVAGPR